MHTPGPWTIKHGTNIMGIRWDVGHEGSVATCGGMQSNMVECRPESEANARLISAAPDMLAALEKIASGAYANHELAGDIARAAILKAKGRI